MSKLTAFTLCSGVPARVKQGDTLAITIALLPIVFPQMPVRFSAYVTYDWDFHKARHPDGMTPLVHDTSHYQILGWVSEKCLL